MKKQPKFFVWFFADYHEIIYPVLGYRSRELGCFPYKGSSYAEHLGVFWKNRTKPTLDEIWPEIENYIETSEDYPTIDDIKKEIKRHL